MEYFVAKTSGRKHRRIAARVAAAAITAALVGTGTSAVAADSPQPSLGTAAEAPSAATTAAAATVAPNFALYGLTTGGDAYAYRSNGKGGITDRDLKGSGWQGVSNLLQVSNVPKSSGDADGIWYRESNGYLGYLKFDATATVKVGTGWNIYNKLVSPGNVGGAGAGDLLGRDSSGALYLYLGLGTGKLTSRYKVGSGWNIYNQIAGNGDLSGDGKNDVVARDAAGVLWLYKGTGNYKAPFTARTKIGSGWNTYNQLISTGDISEDGKTDLVARDKTGALYLYKGTGKAATPFGGRVKIGASGWNSYRFLF
ncbi:VCBS repeat-containing protein [Streptomyces poriferorum]|uniref:VCBS repeat-containing protein n=1 Tax=Streptomyces poriferorum TaxID=2798799 RepID=A0ABY9IJW9_9ACTN|nr:MULTISPECIES: VCBS repeat-containing protein [unclassified Streptomyces]MDP5317323.1 VCBS repeat-containing protein [Streptomyces sp. Alt4]WLQ55578.1 VCBS repeat-containing protein [Streptomyces sp. Alt2]